MTDQPRAGIGFVGAGPLGGRWVYGALPIAAPSGEEDYGSSWGFDVSPLRTPTTFEEEYFLTRDEYRALTDSWRVAWLANPSAAQRSYLFEPPWRDREGMPPPSWRVGESYLIVRLARALRDDNVAVALRCRAAALSLRLLLTHADGEHPRLVDNEDLFDAARRIGLGLALMDDRRVIAVGGANVEEQAVMAAPSWSALVNRTRSHVDGVRSATDLDWPRGTAQRLRRLANGTLGLEDTTLLLQGTGAVLVVIPLDRPVFSLPAAESPWRELSLFA